MKKKITHPDWALAHKKSGTELKLIKENIFIDGELISGNYITIKDFDERKDIFIVKLNQKFGLINDKKKLILPIEYDTIERPHLADYFYITKNRMTGVVSEKGEIIIPFEYEHIEYDWKEQKTGEKDGFIVQKNNKLGSIDYYNNVIIPIEYDGISNWVEYGPHAHYVKKDSLYGLINYDTGELFIPVCYSGIYVHSAKCIEIKKNSHYGSINIKNEVIIPCIYDKIYFDLNYFGFEKKHNDKIFAEKDKKWYEFEISGKLTKSKIDIKGIKDEILSYKPDSNEYRYHLKDCMVFPK